jgi:iron complex outermembrane recepter protein
MRMSSAALRTFRAAIALVVATTGLAHAQDASDSSGSGSSATQLEEVTVTATKRAESLQTVPVSVTAITSAVFERNNVRELGDLANLSPALVINYGSQPGNYNISLRGIGTFSNGIAVESDVAVVIDDVPIGYQAAAFKDLIDVDRVEVLRGSQSTLFGKSAIAGVINITTAAPTHEWEGKVSGLATDDDEKRIGFTVSGPLSDTVRVRLTVADSSYDGNVVNITAGRKVGGSSGLTATGKIEWQPLDNLTFSFAPRFNRDQNTCCVSPITSLTPGLSYQGLAQLPESTVLAGIPIGSTMAHSWPDIPSPPSARRITGGCSTTRISTAPPPLSFCITRRRLRPGSTAEQSFTAISTLTRSPRNSGSPLRARRDCVTWQGSGTRAMRSTGI